MGFMGNIKGQKAYVQHGKGNYAEALKLYEEALAAGMDNPRNLLAYSSLLVRSGEYQKARDLLVKIQKAPGMSAEQKMQLFCNYAAAVYKLGEIDKGIGILERQHAKAPSGLVYETLGYLYVARCEDKPDLENAEIAENMIDAHAENPSEAAADEENQMQVTAEATPSPMEAYEQLLAKAKAFLEEAVDYDDEDAVCLDNLAQFYYRILGDKTAAKQWFEKAIGVKDSQIDTLWFLSRYDVEAGDNESAIKKLRKSFDGRFSPLNYATKDMVKEELARLGSPEND